jgi:hypothetical protein
MKRYQRGMGIVALVGGWGICSAQAGWAQVSPERLAALTSRLGQVQALARRLPEAQRRALSGGAQNLLTLAARLPEMAPRLHPPSAEGGRQGLGPEALVSPPFQVSDPTPDVAFSSLGGFTQNETSTAWCGDTVVVGFNDSGSVFESLLFGPGGVSFNGVARSTNRGASFQDLGFLNPGATVENFLGGDPVLVCTAPTTFYYASILVTLTASQISVSQSTDGGLSFGEPVAAVGKDIPTHFLEKPWLAADPTNAQRLYVTYSDFDLSGTHCGVDFFGVPIPRIAIELVRSTDGGTTWSTPVVIEEVCDPAVVQGSQVAVGPGGGVYVAWEAIAADVLVREIALRKSTDHGSSFGTRVQVSAVTPVGDGFLLQGAFRSAFELPSLAVDHSGSGSPTQGNVYISWHDGRNLILDDVISGVYRYADVLLSRSSDGGATWSAPVRVNDTIEPPRGPGTDQYQPGVAVDHTTGAVGVCFYDRRNDPQNFLIDRWWE